MIATEAGAEGINLQFCSLVVNYDLPWNPQRIEQRIGRCHRYGQKFDVVVVNFLNQQQCGRRARLRAARREVPALQGVFGASDEVLGAIESGVDFEKRIADIYQNCREPAQIRASFEQLQLDLSGEISETMVKTRQLLLENFDEQVQEKLRVRAEDSRAARSKYERMLMDLTRRNWAIARPLTTTGSRCISFRRPCSPLPWGEGPEVRASIALGRYELPRRSGDAHLPRSTIRWRLGITEQAKARALPTAPVLSSTTTPTAPRSARSKPIAARPAGSP